MSRDLEALRGSVTAEQREMLDLIWAAQCETPEGLLARRLYQKFPKKKVVPALTALGGNIVYEARNVGVSHYGLTFLGCLLTSRGPGLEIILSNYLRLLSKTVMANPTATEVTGKDLESGLGLDSVESKELFCLLRACSLHHGGPGLDGERSVKIPEDVDDINDEDDIRQWVRDRALRGFDPKTPIETGQAWAYAQNKRHRENKANTQPTAEDLAEHYGSIPSDRDEPEPLLEPEQWSLLNLVVEASRNIKKQDRQKFLVINVEQNASILVHPGLKNDRDEAYIGDVEILANEGLLNLTYTDRGKPQFDVTPQGYETYERRKRSSAEPAATLEATVRVYLDSDRFRARHQKAFERWHHAEDLLWGADSREKLTAVGHFCREALQEFADQMIVSHKLESGFPDKARTKNRLRGVLEVQGASAGQREQELLAALLGYWEAVSDFVQRQEHGGQKEGRELTWEDGRRAVFQTAIVMYEFDLLLSR